MAYRGILGILVFLFIAWVFSQDKKKVSWQLMLGGLGVQLLIAVIVFKVPYIKHVFFYMSQFVSVLEKSMKVGAQFVFGYLSGGDQPFQLAENGNPFILAFQALPLLIFMSALSSLLFYWKILPIIINTFSFLFQKTLRVGGALGVGSAANIFFGMAESPMCVKPYLKDMSESELFSFMTVGMSTVAGSVMVVYASILSGSIDGVIGHILSASIISVPAAITISRIMIPETSKTVGSIQLPNFAKNAMDAISRGTSDGIQVFINVVAMLLVLISLVHLANTLLAFLPELAGKPITLQGLFGYIFAPIVWLIGIPADQAQAAGTLMGTKTVLNELIAYIDLSQLSNSVLDSHSKLIMIYALCGFANIGSIGILIGALGTLVPERRDCVIKLGFRTVLSGTLATLMTGAIVSLFL